MPDSHVRGDTRSDRTHPARDDRPASCRATLLRSASPPRPISERRTVARQRAPKLGCFDDFFRTPAIRTERNVGAPIRSDPRYFSGSLRPHGAEVGTPSTRPRRRFVTSSVDAKRRTYVGKGHWSYYDAPIFGGSRQRPFPGAVRSPSENPDVGSVPMPLCGKGAWLKTRTKARRDWRDVQIVSPSRTSGERSTLARRVRRG